MVFANFFECYKEEEVVIDGHVHIESGDYSIQWINKFVKYALARGISEIYLLEHSHRFIEFKETYQNIASYNKYQGSWLNRKMILSIDTYKELIYIIRKHQFPLTIKFGLEVCFVEGAESIIKNILKEFEWDFITGSVHWIDNWGFDHKKDFWEGKDIDKINFRYYEIMKSLIKSGLFNIVAHPDSIKCFGYFPSYDLTKTYSEIADLLIEYNMFAEQSAGLYLNYGYPSLGMNQIMYDVFIRKGVTIITASDAHRPEDTGKYIEEMIKV